MCVCAMHGLCVELASITAKGRKKEIKKRRNNEAVKKLKEHHTNTKPQSTHPSPATPSPFTAMARTRSLPSSFPVSLTSSAPTHSHHSASWPKATRACRRVSRVRTRRMTRTTFPISSRVRTSKARPTSSKSLSFFT